MLHLSHKSFFNYLKGILSIFQTKDDRHDNSPSVIYVSISEWIQREVLRNVWLVKTTAVSQWNTFNTISAFMSPVWSNVFGLYIYNKQEKSEILNMTLRPVVILWWYMRFEEDLFCRWSGPCGCRCLLKRPVHAG